MIIFERFSEFVAISEAILEIYLIIFYKNVWNNWGCGRFSKSSLLSGLDSISHRGPKAEGYWDHESVKFVHEGLAIIDLSEVAN